MLPLYVAPDAQYTFCPDVPLLLPLAVAVLLDTAPPVNVTVPPDPIAIPPPYAYAAEAVHELPVTVQFVKLTGVVLWIYMPPPYTSVEDDAEFAFPVMVHPVKE